MDHSKALLILFPLLLTINLVDSEEEGDSTVAPAPKPRLFCAKIPHSFAPLNRDLVSSTYNSTREELFLDLTDLVHKFCADEVYNSSVAGTFRLELIRTERSSIGRALCPSISPSGARTSRSWVQSSVLLSPTNPVTIFRYAQGAYALRFSECPRGGMGTCQVISCSSVIRLEPSVSLDVAACSAPPSNVTAASVSDVTQVLQFHTCSVSLASAVPLCTARQVYHRARVFTAEVPLGRVDCDFARDFLDGGQLENATIGVARCDQKSRHSACADVVNSSMSSAAGFGVLEHKLYDLDRNKSYCVFYQLENPHCRLDSSSSSLLPACFFRSRLISCSLLETSALSLLTQPVFVAAVSLTLFFSLALLCWTVVQCSRKRPETPVMMQPPIKKPPRSLTEDDLEHISRLPSQEIVLVYFPDTKRFKELNRRFRDWLITLDVNDVKDIYDEKCSEEVLKDPEAWVRSALGGPEKRVILVCSRLAYECLATVKRGISSPKFVETDPHFGLLTRAIQYLDREMRGNYRNLICVRYEDLKICDRQYSSEAFNIVPGTEYVLPQHLEDVYRWIHPRDPKPECWSESRTEVTELLDYMRRYRLHDDNVFTVQFSSEAGGDGDGRDSPDLGIERAPQSELI